MNDLASTPTTGRSRLTNPQLAYGRLELLLLLYRGLWLAALGCLLSCVALVRLSLLEGLGLSLKLGQVSCPLVWLGIAMDRRWMRELSRGGLEAGSWA